MRQVLLRNAHATMDIVTQQESTEKHGQASTCITPLSVISFTPYISPVCDILRLTLVCLNVEDEHDSRKRSRPISNSDASVSPKSPQRKVCSMIYFHATSNRKILLYSITNEVNQTADIAAPMPGHTSHPTSRGLTTYTKKTRLLLQRLQGTMLMLVTLCATCSISTSWFLTSGIISQTSRYVPDVALPSLHHLPYFARLRNSSPSLNSIEIFFLLTDSKHSTTTQQSLMKAVTLMTRWTGRMNWWTSSTLPQEITSPATNTISNDQLPEYQVFFIIFGHNIDTRFHYPWQSIEIVLASHMTTW